MESGRARAARLIPTMRFLMDWSYSEGFVLLFPHLPREDGKCDYVFLALFAGVSVKISFPRP